MATKKVYIGVGHGGKDAGAVANGFKEKDVNLEIAKACETALKRSGVSVKISRTNDSEVWLEDRIAECNKYNPDIALDIHNNAGGGDPKPDERGLNVVAAMGVRNGAPANADGAEERAKAFAASERMTIASAEARAMLEMQDYLQGLNPSLPANYDFTDGVHSFHIPATSVSRDISSGNRVDKVETSQGYLMDVYENHIVLKDRDFVKGEFIPIAHYCVDTTL